MEIVFAWFWLIKAILLILIYITLYLGIKKRNYRIEHNIKARFNIWLILFSLLMIIFMISPMKINGTNSVQVNENIDQSIKQSKALPPVKVDNSFNESNSLNGISKDDLK